MHVYSILAAATGASDTANYPYILGLLALIISIVAILRVSALSRDLKQSAVVPTPLTSPAPAATAKTSSVSTPATTHDGIAPEIIAAIAAAVATVTGKSHRIISIKPMSTSWEKAGRQSVLTSHRIR